MANSFNLEAFAENLWTAEKVWLFAKGPSFNESFDWAKATQPGHVRIAVSQAVEYVMDPHLCLMFDKRVQAVIPDRYQHLIQSELLPGMQMCHSSGEFAIRFIGTIAPGITITSVGLDAGLIPYGQASTYGFEYKKRPGHIPMPKHMQEAAYAEVGRYVNQALATYKLKLERY